MGVLDERVAIVTGAGQGVGRGVALALSGEGARVVVAGRTVAKCEEVAAEIRSRGGEALAVACDVTLGSDIDGCVAATVQHFGTIDILVNNAQQVPRGALLEVDEADVQAGWDSGPLATLRFMRRCHPHLSGGGVIVNLGSRAGVKPNPSGSGVYAAVKEAVRAMTRAAAWEWAPDGIRAYALLPLSTSPGMDHLERFEPDVYEQVLSEIPMRRMGDPETDIGRVVVFLCGPDAAYLTGITLPVDGGAAHIG